MSTEETGILEYESALSDDAKRQLRKLGRADILIGIPSHRNGRTIGEVIDALVRGIAAYYPDRRVVLVNADGGSADSTVRLIQDAQVPHNVAKLLCGYEGVTGKGTAIRAILEAAGRLHAGACFVVEARAPGIRPDWLPALINPVLQGDDLTLACYHRSAHAMSLTDNLAYPFLHAFLHADVRDPLAPEFCVSGRVARDMAACDVWETNVSRYGVNVWIALHGLTAGLRMSQVDLGYRGENGGEPGMLLDARFLHTVSTLFRSLTTYRRLWQRDPSPRHVAFRGGCHVDEALPCDEYVGVLLAAMREGQARYLDEWTVALAPDTLAEVRELLSQADDAFAFPIDLWARVALSFAMLFNKGEGDPDKVAEALLPIYYGRTAAYIHETSGLTPTERDRIVDEIVDAYLAQKEDFVRRWNTYQPWVEDSSRFWLT
jgi:hypothetical protein